MGTPQVTPPRIRSGMAFILIAAFLTAGALALHYWAGPPQPSRPPKISAGSGSSASRPVEADMGVGESYLDGAMQTLSGDPADLAPPARASRIVAQQYVIGPNVEQRAAYRCPGATAEEVAAHYRAALDARGYVPRICSTGRADRLVLVYDKGRSRVIIRAVRPSAQGQALRVLVTAVAPAEK
jgi:hypothetical protein